MSLKQYHIVADAELLSVDFWECIALKNEHKSWDDWYITETVMDAEFYSERDDMPCPECGETLDVFFGQIDQDWQGNDIHGAGFICRKCGFDDIEEIGWR